MSNHRFIIFFFVGIVACAAVLWYLSARARIVASDATRHVLCPVDPDTATSLSITVRGGPTTTLARESDKWRIVAPYPAAADAAPVARALDLLTLTPINDMRSEDELRQLGEDLSDFGLRPPRATISLVAAGATNIVHFGVLTASSNEVYACVDGLLNVFTIAASAFAAIATDADSFRPRALLSCPRDEITGIEFRVPDAPFVKLVREGKDWRMSAPLAAAADTAAVSTLADHLVAARIADFIMPSAAQPPPNGTASDGILSAASLVPYGLSADAALALTVRAVDGSAETILFGGAAGTNRVWALVQNGAAVVSVDASLAELCRTHEAAFRDTRVFSLKTGEAIKSISLTTDSLVYVLGRETNGLWRIDTPVVAPADQVVASDLADKILALKQNDLSLPDAKEKPNRKILVAVATSAANYPAIAVPTTCFGETFSFADLRSKILLTLDPGTVHRLCVKKPSNGAPAAVYDASRAVWNLEKPIEGRRLSPAAIKALLTALSRVEAVNIETVAATPADFRRCGLDAPACTVTIDLESENAARLNVLIGGAASGGGRYATVGGADAVFVVSKQTAAALMAELTE